MPAPTEAPRTFEQAERKRRQNELTYRRGLVILYDSVQNEQCTAPALQHYINNADAIVPLSVTTWAERTGRNVQEARLHEAVTVFFRGDVRIAMAEKKKGTLKERISEEELSIEGLETSLARPLHFS